MRRSFLIWILLPLMFVPACREQSKEELFQQGMEFIESEKPQAAANLFKQALDQDPNFISARLQLGLAYLESNKLDKAEAELKKVLHQNPEETTASIHLAKVYLADNQPEEAIRQLENLSSDAPDYPEALHILARAHGMLENFPLSEDLFRKSLQLRPKHVKTELGLAQLLYMTNRFDEGTQLVDEVIDSHPDEINAYYLLLRKSFRDGQVQDAIQTLEKIRGINPDDSYASYILGMLYLDTDKDDSALKIANDLLSRRPNHPVAHRLKGVAFYKAGDYENAIVQLQKSVLGMQDLAGFYFLGLANYQLGQFELAISNFQKALDKSPEHEKSRLMIAQTFLKQGRIEDGIRQVNVVLGQDPNNANAHNILASAFMLQKKYDLAMEQIEKAVQLDPGLAQAHLKKGLFNLAAGRKHQGEMDLSNAVAAAPEILNTRLLLATYFLRMQNYPKVLELLEEGLAISSDNAVIYNFIAAAQLGQKKMDAAIQSLQKAKTLEPRFFSPYFNLANLYISRKDYQAAKAEYEAVLQIDPNALPALLKMAALLEFLGESAQAETYYQRAAQTQSPEGFLALAAFLRRINQMDRVLETLSHANQVHPENADLRIAYGASLAAAERYDDAIDVYVQLEETQPGMGKPYLLVMHLKKGDTDAAKEIADRAIAENRASPQGYLLKSTVYEDLADWSLAEKTLREGLAATQQNSTLKMHLARLYNHRSDHEKALEVYDSTLSKDPDNVSALFGKASTLDAMGNKKQAQNLYERVLALDENYIPALNNLAYLLLDVYAENQRALNLASKGFRHNPTDPRIIDTLGFALLRNGYPEKAIPFLEKAARLMPGEVQIQIHLVEAYKAAGRNDDAVASLSAIKSMKAQQAQVEKAQAILEGLN